MEVQSALFASNKCIKMASIVIPVLIVKEYVQCVESKFSTPSHSNRAMYDVAMADNLTFLLISTLILENCSYFVNAIRSSWFCIHDVVKYLKELHLMRSCKLMIFETLVSVRLYD
ncbi:hypothetical protein RND71_033370 [Anisodus tanguticus]|uniref:Uncharacterized protein n=1 Tax=Anisodus tanguticus TaxID=243964 RepID=A0AAE1R981_9SOLA|nr:hypothetical protein RND71_033370 [Anisodus tanguticus]